MCVSNFNEHSKKLYALNVKSKRNRESLGIPSCSDILDKNCNISSLYSLPFLNEMKCPFKYILSHFH